MLILNKWLFQNPSASAKHTGREWKLAFLGDQVLQCPFLFTGQGLSWICIKAKGTSSKLNGLVAGLFCIFLSSYLESKHYYRLFWLPPSEMVFWIEHISGLVMGPGEKAQGVWEHAFKFLVLPLEQSKSKVSPGYPAAPRGYLPHLHQGISQGDQMSKTGRGLPLLWHPRVAPDDFWLYFWKLPSTSTALSHRKEP